MPNSIKDSQTIQPSFSSDAKNLDALLEEYTSKLEQKLMAQTQQLRTITDNAASSLFMIDVKGRATYMNPAAEKVTGYRLSEIKNKSLDKVIHKPHVHDGQPADFCNEIRPLTQFKQIKDYEDTFVRKNGEYFPVSFSVAPLSQDGQLTGAVLEFQDISKRKELERQKDEFVGIASHELKTPVTSMKTYTQVLKRKFEKQGDDLAAESLDKIDAQINKLTALISDLLDVTRMQTGNLTLRHEKFDLDTMVREIVENIQLTTDVHDIHIQGSAKTVVQADRDRTGQVLINFLTNAIKYSPHSQEIVVRVTHKKDTVIVGVQDFGIGIPPDKKDKVFERFMRVSGPMMETFPGLGLGLYISAQIIRRQGGKIWVESEENKGSTFYFSLPVQATSPRSSSNQAVTMKIEHE